MIVIPGRPSGQMSEERGPTFTGQVWADPVLPNTGQATINTVFFTPAAHTFWHHHEQGQILQVVAGLGLVCAEDTRAELIRSGDVVWAPPGERHWHGATAGSIMGHVAISLGTTVWGREVADSEYRAANDQ